MRVEIASAIAFVAVTMTGCSGGCSIPEWSADAQCKTEDLSKIGDGSCTSAADVTKCVEACGVPAKQSCVQDCYTKQCPDVSANCLTCYSNLYSCAQCAATTKKDATSTCSDPYQVCVGISPPLFAATASSTPAATNATVSEVAV
mmetsp:Transcript_57867/g.124509  ORF Transcript_57867/g.124509 Transcript_57867/m.124509 type:complete len:145 (-) Transcript_57867:109-543(-)